MRVRGKVRQSLEDREKELLSISVVSDLEFDGRAVDREGGRQDHTAATTGTITTAVSMNLGVQQRCLKHSTDSEEGRAAKRKPFSSPSGPQTKPKYSSLSVATNTSGSIKESFSVIEEVVALNPQSNVVDQRTILEDSGRVCFVPFKSCLAQASKPGIRFWTPGDGWWCRVAAPGQGCELNSPFMSNVLINQPGKASLPKVVHPAQSISEKEQDHEAIKEAAFIPVHNTEEINSEVIWEQIQKPHDDFVSLGEPAFGELLEQVNKLVMENKRLKDGQMVLLQQVKDQKQMIDELSKQNRAEVDCFKEETAQLIKDKEELQRRLLRASELVKLITDACAMLTKKIGLPGLL